MQGVQRKTPGVYVTELNAFPPSIVGIETAIPAFIGYTEKANLSGESYTLKPLRISSLAEFHEVFGEAHKAQFKLAEVTEAANLADGPATVPDPAKPFIELGTDDAKVRYTIEPSDTLFYLYHSLQLFYANGGGDCYVVSVGAFASAVAEEDLKKGLTAIYDEIGPTMLVVPDALLLPDPDSFKNVIVAMLSQCGNLGDRVAILDVYGSNEMAPASGLEKKIGDLIKAFRNGTGTEFLKYGMAYFPALQASLVHESDLSLDNFDTEAVTLITEEVKRLFSPDKSSLVQRLTDATADADAKAKAVTDAVTTATTAVETATAAAAAAKTKADTPGASDKDKRDSAAAQATLDKATAAKTVADAEKAVADAKKTATEAKATAGKPGATEADKSASATADTALATAVAAAPPAPSPEAVEAERQSLNNDLKSAMPALKQCYARMAAKLNILPTSGAMAGVYAQSDRTRGVWNAPANIGLNSVVDTTFRITAKIQEDLNVPIEGKAVNAIREFVGRGTLVWGARTLDGNSDDWRYIQVRRTLIYVEQSVKLALNQFVFAANNGQTWVAVTAMISNFLQGLWSQGGLMGAKASEAFTVQCGLGTTMTGQDVLGGYMKVQVTLQMIHPAEFIELTFKQQMQGV